MADKVVIVSAGAQQVSLPFEQIDEILGADRMKSLQDLPEGSVPDNSSDRFWVNSRGAWLTVKTLLPGTSVSESSQIVVVRLSESGEAFAVDHVLGIEAPGEMAVFPKRARRFTDFPIAGVGFWKGNPVLELDLSRLISLNLES